MPLVRISLLRGKSPDYLRGLADGVHQALVETYGVPPDDRFQLIHQHAPEEFFCNPDYLGIHRSADAVFVQVAASNWRDGAAKQALYRRMTEILADRPGLRPEDVQIVLSPNERADWSLGGGRASYPAA